MNEDKISDKALWEMLSKPPQHPNLTLQMCAAYEPEKMRPEKLQEVNDHITNCTHCTQQRDEYLKDSEARESWFSGFLF
jgi:hypothetical protein